MFLNNTGFIPKSHCSQEFHSLLTHQKFHHLEWLLKTHTNSAHVGHGKNPQEFEDEESGFGIPSAVAVSIWLARI